MHEIGRRRRNQPAPPEVVFESLTDLNRPGTRPWLNLLDDEQRPQLLRTQAPTTVVWSSIYDATVDHLRKRMNVLINPDLRYSYGQ